MDAGTRAKEVGAALTSGRGARMFGRHTVANTIAFLLDLAILWALVEIAGMPRMSAAVIAFLVPMVVLYVLCREWVFPQTNRGWWSGFVYFAANIGIGFLVMMAVFWSLLEFTDLHYLVARVAASAVCGIVVFLLNGIFNFKEL